MQGPIWDLKLRLEALNLNVIDRNKLNSQEPRKRQITILNWAKCIRADGKTLFAIARVPFLNGDTGLEKRKTAVEAWLNQNEAVRDYFFACSAQVIAGNLDAISEVLDLYGGPCFMAQLPLPEEMGRSHQKQRNQTLAFEAARHAQNSPFPTPKMLAQSEKETKQGGKKCPVTIERSSLVVPPERTLSATPATLPSNTKQTRYSLRSSTKRADVADASSSVSSWSHLHPSGLTSPDFTHQQLPRSVQSTKNT